MNTKDLLIQEIERVPEPLLDEVLDFLGKSWLLPQERYLGFRADRVGENDTAQTRGAKASTTQICRHQVAVFEVRSR